MIEGSVTIQGIGETSPLSSIVGLRYGETSTTPFHRDPELALQVMGDARAAEAAIALAHKVFARAEPVVGHQPVVDNAREVFDVRLGAVEELLRLGLGHQRAAEAGADRIDKDQVGEVEPCAGVVHQRRRITSVLKQEIAGFEQKLKVSSVGTVIEVGDGIARIYGLRDAMAGELLEFEHGVMGQVFNLEEDSIGAVIFGEYLTIKEGDTVKSTGRLLEVPVGDGIIGRVVNPLGEPLDGGPPHPEHGNAEDGHHRPRHRRP